MWVDCIKSGSIYTHLVFSLHLFTLYTYHFKTLYSLHLPLIPKIPQQLPPNPITLYTRHPPPPPPRVFLNHCSIPSHVNLWFLVSNWNFMYILFQGWVLLHLFHLFFIIFPKLLSYRKLGHEVYTHSFYDPEPNISAMFGGYRWNKVGLFGYRWWNIFCNVHLLMVEH